MNGSPNHDVVIVIINQEMEVGDDISTDWYGATFGVGVGGDSPFAPPLTPCCFIKCELWYIPWYIVMGS